MYVVRPVTERDLPALLSLAGGIEGGLTTVPPEEKALRERIEGSLRAFNLPARRPGSEYYLFVLEEEASGEVIGTSAITARVGGFDPFYSYEIREESFTHAPLQVDKRVAVLCLKEVHDGPTELGGLFVRPDRRRAGLGRLLSLSRLLFMAAFPERFTGAVIAELRGYVDAQGRSPFWEAVGRIFFEHDFATADSLTGIGKQFIADLMPRHPIYVPLLPAAVQAVIGRVHRNSEAALAMLLAEGFVRLPEVDIFDAGPLVHARLSRIRAVRDRRTAVLGDLAENTRDVGQAVDTPMLVANPSLGFRCALGSVEQQGNGRVAIAPSLAAALRLRPGDATTYVPASAARGGQP